MCLFVDKNIFSKMIVSTTGISAHLVMHENDPCVSASETHSTHTGFTAQGRRTEAKIYKNDPCMRALAHTHNITQN